jgi:hypothetical protein
MLENHNLLDTLTVPLKYRNTVNNASFAVWNNHVMGNLSYKDRYNHEGDDYTGEDVILLRYCKNHVKKNAKPLNSKNVVVLTHPLFMFITHSHLLGPIRSIGANKYRDNLSKLLYSKSSIDANIVLFDTVHHYADSTSKLLEDGLIDYVFFTKYNKGVPDDEGFMKFLNLKNLYFGGGYNGKCLTSTVRHVTGSVSCRSKWCISSLSIDSPEDGLRINGGRISDGRGYLIPPKFTVTLDTFLEMHKK